ncbi:formate dehydrogenase subunit delta [Chelativorans intermedius]|uniref:Formate dehydrogenase subunit delta n=1 Tax=Chelativorans intermedius TaxID=515947 RepID=A0ABV6D5R5_9HYPH|nr:formate dehydrogenase subunit delta [Chelativorans intermedius]MCT8998887.1 formate dehydrogenase subunit delta [Chelativorans intermedius]
MSHEAGYKTGEEKLVYMANQIARFFEAMPHEEAVSGVADHINKFWEPRMRRHLFEIVARGGEGLRPLVLEAAQRVKRPREADA